MAKLEEAYPSEPTRARLTRVKWYRRLWLWLIVSLGVPLIIAAYGALRFLPDRTAHYENTEEHLSEEDFSISGADDCRHAGRVLRSVERKPTIPYSSIFGTLSKRRTSSKRSSFESPAGS